MWTEAAAAVGPMHPVVPYRPPPVSPLSPSSSLQTLLANGLRDRVVLRVDGGLRAGTDVLLAAAMGADEFGFGSVAMIATGCIMARICHTNNCPVGVASQVSNSAGIATVASRVPLVQGAAVCVAPASSIVPKPSHLSLPSATGSGVTKCLS